jgi:TatD DNase family protein
MKFIDTHCHIDLLVAKGNDGSFNSVALETGPQQKIDQDKLLTAKQIIAEAKVAGVTKIINIGCDFVTSKNSVTLAGTFEGVFATVGLHPCDANGSWKQEVDKIKALTKNIAQDKIVGIGEIGLDYYHKPYNKQNQSDAFRAQIELALALDLPLSIHVREAADDLLRILEEYRSEIRGVIHCFQQEEYFATQVVEWGLLVGIDGPITYPKNDRMREIVAGIPLEHIILETDSPFLPPQKMRGKTNVPANVLAIAQGLAEVFKVDVEEIAKQTTANAEKLFKI